MRRGSQFLIGVTAAVLTFVALNFTLGERLHRDWGYGHGWHGNHHGCGDGEKEHHDEKGKVQM